MNLAITRIKQIIPHFNEQALTEKDFWKICENEEIRVVETHLFVNGFYFSDGRRNFIYLNSALRGAFWLENAFHEIAHHFLHTPPTNPRQEEEARAITLISILPRSQLKKVVSEADEFSDYAERILHERLQIFAEHGL